MVQWLCCVGSQDYFVGFEENKVNPQFFRVLVGHCYAKMQILMSGLYAIIHIYWSEYNYLKYKDISPQGGIDTISCSILKL